MSQTGELIIDLNAIQNNWDSLCRRMSSHVDCAAVVKADAYGLGVHSVAESLYQQGCRSFFVTTVVEGITLRQTLPHMADIYLLQGYAQGEEATLIEHKLIPVLISMPMLHHWISTSAQLATGKDRPPCALKVDTGMTRLGIGLEEFESIVQQESFTSVLNPVLVMSHLACADQPGHSLNAVQLERFKEVCTHIRKVFPIVKASLANSSGIFLGKDWHFDMVRPGMALYGMNPIPRSPNPMTSVLNLRLPVIQLRQAMAGESVGYGASYTLNQSAWLATVAGGYADGIPRSLGNAWRGHIHGYSVPLIGRVSMDSTVFDVSMVVNALPDESDPVKQITWIDILNQQLSIDDMAQAASTIPYEIMIRLGERLQRKYVRTANAQHREVS